MDTARTERAARLRRILSRAAVVVGGAAAAWLLSTATASAGTAESAGLTGTSGDIVAPVVDTLVQQKPRQVTEIVETVLPAAPATAASTVTATTAAANTALGLDKVGAQVQGTVEQVTAQLPVTAPGTELRTVVTAVSAVSPVTAASSGASAQPRLLTADDVEAGAQPVVHPEAATPQLAPALVAGPERVAAHDVRRAPVAESPRYHPPAGDAATALPALPHPPMPMPLPPVPSAPVSVCSACGNGGSNDDHFGIAVEHTWPSPVSGLATSQALRLFSQHIAPAAGEQPGVTPD